MGVIQICNSFSLSIYEKLRLFTCGEGGGVRTPSVVSEHILSGHGNDERDDLSGCWDGSANGNATIRI